MRQIFCKSDGSTSRCGRYSRAARGNRAAGKRFPNRSGEVAAPPEGAAPYRLRDEGCRAVPGVVFAACAGGPPGSAAHSRAARGNRAARFVGPVAPGGKGPGRRSAPQAEEAAAGRGRRVFQAVRIRIRTEDCRRSRRSRRGDPPDRTPQRGDCRRSDTDS